MIIRSTLWSLGKKEEENSWVRSESSTDERRLVPEGLEIGRENPKQRFLA